MCEHHVWTLCAGLPPASVLRSPAAATWLPWEGLYRDSKLQHKQGQAWMCIYLQPCLLWSFLCQCQPSFYVIFASPLYFFDICRWNNCIASQPWFCQIKRAFLFLLIKQPIFLIQPVVFCSALHQCPLNTALLHCTWSCKWHSATLLMAPLCPTAAFIPSLKHLKDCTRHKSHQHMLTEVKELQTTFNSVCKPP